MRNREPGMVEDCTRPGGRVVAALAGGGESGRHMIRIRRALIIHLVAGIAVCRRTREHVVDVATGAGNVDVRARQRERGVVVVEGSARPTRRVVADGTVGRKSSRRVTRVIGVLVVGLVATEASRVGTGQAEVVVHMALLALQRGVRTGKRESRCRMIERGARPIGCAVAHGAIRREARSHVVGISSFLEIRQVAGGTGRVGTGQVVVAVHMALLALQRSVRTGERKARGGVVKRRIGPRGGVVALLAGRREVGLHVVRIRRPLEFLHVAGGASTRRPREDPIQVALAARHVDMSARQRKGGKLAVVERHSCPVCRAVADGTILWEPCLDVIGILCAREVLQVATDAVCGSDFEIPIHVAGGAVQRGVHAGQGEACKLPMIKRYTQPTVHVMADLASRRKLRHPMIRNGLSKRLCVTGDALCGKPLELADRRSLVTFVASERGMRTDQGETVLVILDGLQ